MTDERHPGSRSGTASSSRSHRSGDDLAGRGRTALTPEQALRARDVDQPTAEELERAESDVKIVRRNWTPPPS